MTVPSDYDFIGNTITESQFKDALTVLLNHIRQMSLDLVEAQGGNYSYATMALFDVDKRNVPANSTIRIAQGDDAGLYVWDGSNLTPAKESNFFESSDSENLHEFKDANGNVVAFINKDGMLKNLAFDLIKLNLSDIESELLELGLKQQDAKTLLSKVENEHLFLLKDKNEVIVLYVDKNGDLRSPTLDKMKFELDELNNSVQQNTSKNLLEFQDQNGTILGYVDENNNWFLNGKKVSEGDVGENESSTIDNSKSYFNEDIAFFKKPESIIKINLKNVILPLPTDKSFMRNADGFIECDGKSMNFYATIEVQGAGSVQYPKKNWTIAFYKDEERTQPFSFKLDSLPPFDEMIFKSNWIDYTNIHNSLGYQLWEQFVASRKGYPRSEIDLSYVGKTSMDAIPTGANGVPKLFPAVLYINDEFYGIGCFGSGKKRDNYNIAKNKATQLLLITDAWIDIKNLPTETSPAFEIKCPSKPTAATVKAIQDWNAFTKLEGSSFSNEISKHTLKSNIIDFIIFSELICSLDNTDSDNLHNTIIISYDGKIFKFMPYDMDNIFGLGWDEILKNTQVYQMVNGVFWNKVYTFYKEDIEKRYSELRSHIISIENLYDLAHNLTDKYSLALYLKESDRWGRKPTQDGASLQQLISWSQERITFLDTFFNYVKK
ncbi:CotH kinase family protein [Acinetobacter baumannii]|uniref:CotH kinase family protein n=1 Tax=Acinetobacter baumannii TaxID=470 RepID=UPI0036F46C03